VGPELRSPGFGNEASGPLIGADDDNPVSGRQPGLATPARHPHAPAPTCLLFLVVFEPHPVTSEMLPENSNIRPEREPLFARCRRHASRVPGTVHITTSGRRYGAPAEGSRCFPAGTCSARQRGEPPPFSKSKALAHLSRELGGESHDPRVGPISNAAPAGTQLVGVSRTQGAGRGRLQEASRACGPTGLAATRTRPHCSLPSRLSAGGDGALLELQPDYLPRRNSTG